MATTTAGQQHGTKANNRLVMCCRAVIYRIQPGGGMATGFEVGVRVRVGLAAAIS